MSKKIAMALIYLMAGNFLFAQSKSDFEFSKDGTGANKLVTITKYTGRQENVRIPKKLDDEKVAIIEKDAFNPSVSGGPALASLTFDSDNKELTTIGETAFANNRLSQLVLPAGVKSVEAGAFRANRIKNLTLPDGIGLDEDAFAGNAIETIKIGRDASLVPSAIDREFVPYYEARGRSAGTYIYRSGKWNTEQEIKEQDRVRELNAGIEQEQRLRRSLEGQLEQELQKQKDLKRQIEDIGTSPKGYGWDKFDVEPFAGIGTFFTFGRLADFGLSLDAGLSFRGEKLGLNLQAEAGGAAGALADVHLSGHILGLADLLLMDRYGDPGWGIAAGYGSITSLRTNDRYDEDDYPTIKESFWRFGLSKHGLGNEMLSCLLFFDIAEQTGFRIGFQLSVGY